MELYIHIPFCVKKCRYCDFLSFAGKEACFKDYIAALCAELGSYRQLIREKGLDTIFIGGGTPSILPVPLMEELLGTIDLLIAESGTEPREYTIECNPGTLDREKLRLYRQHGINRLSIGLQSVNDDELKMLGRIHDFTCFLDNYRLAREEGFDNINIDLISALPGQTADSWERTLRTVAELNPEHISAYSLIIEPGTPFYDIYGDNGSAHSYNSNLNNVVDEAETAAVDQGCDEKAAEMPPLPDEDEERRIYRMTAGILAEYGYSRYEISNYSKPGHESKHNLGYWTGADYIGAGLGASSYFCRKGTDKSDMSAVRYKNAEKLTEYINLFSGKDPLDNTDNAGAAALRFLQEGLWNTPNGCNEVSLLNRSDLIGEYMMLHLRLTHGFSVTEFERVFSQNIYDLFGDIIAKYSKLGLMETEKGYICLTESGLDVSNSIMSDFL
ncbi:MAG: radical SAM family heme chaperone HemW [Lachnospiraceae bacterium]|nr:radical SAM family heme chaperone HemW [Lachnospiraceae bacterium]